MCLTPQNLSFTLLYIVTTSRHIRAHHKPAPLLQLTEIFFHGVRLMAALTASCIDLNIQGNGAYSVLKQLATMALQNGFITDSHQFLQTLLLREKCTPPVLVLVSPCRTVKAPALNNRSCYSPAKRRLLTGKPATAKTSIAGSASAYRKVAKRIRSKSSAHCVAKLFTRNLFINCNRAIPTRCLPC